MTDEVKKGSEDKKKMKLLAINKYFLLDSSTSNMTSALAYPSTESDGIYFWSRILERFGLIYLCTPKKSRAPDAYFAKRSELDESARKLIREGLETGNLHASLLDRGIVLGVEFESKASYAKKHFEKGGRERISLICCNDNDWVDAPVPIWSLHDHLVTLEESEPPESEPLIEKPVKDMKTEPVDDEPYAIDIGEYRRLKNSINENQCLVLMAFLFSDIREVPAEEPTKLELRSSKIKDYANRIAEANSKPLIEDIGGVLTAFTQEGAKKDLGILKKGGRAGKRDSNYYLPIKYKPYIKQLASEYYLQWQSIAVTSKDAS